MRNSDWFSVTDVPEASATLSILTPAVIAACVSVVTNLHVPLLAQDCLWAVPDEEYLFG